MPSTDIQDLDENLIPLAEEFLRKLKNAHLEIKVTCTYRSWKEQNDLYAQGRTRPGDIVTNARGGQSEHNAELNGFRSSKAFDIVPIVNGKADWNLKSAAWLLIGNIWKSIKPIDGYYLDWYGKPGAQFSEKCHFCLKSVGHIN